MDFNSNLRLPQYRFEGHLLIHTHCFSLEELELTVLHGLLPPAAHRHIIRYTSRD